MLTTTVIAICWCAHMGGMAFLTTNSNHNKIQIDAKSIMVNTEWVVGMVKSLGGCGVEP